MDVSETQVREIASFGRIVSALLVLFVMGSLFWWCSGDSCPDWFGYGALYDDEGGWLLRTGREPGFIWFVSDARALFGPDGYEAFRFALFCMFTGIATVFAYRLPMQDRLWPFGAFLVVPIVIVAFLLKSLIQIREGLAFLCVLWPTVALFRDHKPRLFRTGAGVVAAGIIHAATMIFSGAWLISVGLFFVPNRIVESPRLQWLLLVMAVAVGGVLLVTLFHSYDALNFLLQDFGVDRRADTQSGLWKYIYWAANGAMMFALRYQLLKAVHFAPKYAYAYATAIASFLLPLTYTICLGLVVTNFELGAVTSMAIRVLFTTMELAILIITLRGRADFLTVGMAVTMLADRARLVVIS